MFLYEFVWAAAGFFKANLCLPLFGDENELDLVFAAFFGIASKHQADGRRTGGPEVL